MTVTKRTLHIADSIDPDTRSGLSYELVDVSIPFEQSYIPYRHRLTERDNLSGPHSVAILTFEAGQAPVAFRIHAVDDVRLPPIEIVSYDDRYWWPLLNGERPVDRERFVSSSSKGNYPVLEVLFNAWTYPGHLGPSLEAFHERWPKCRLVASTFETQVRRVNRGANRIAFCEDRVLIAAGPPIYFGLEATEMAPSNDGIHAGASSLAVTQHRGYGLSRPSRGERRIAAAQGLAFGADELDRLMDAMSLRRMQPHRQSIIETIISCDEDPAPIACMRGLVEKLWNGAKPWNGLDWPWLRKYVPSLANAGERGADFEQVAYRDVLDEFIAFDASTAIRQLKAEAEVARGIVGRLQQQKRPLSNDEDDALFAMAANL